VAFCRAGFDHLQDGFSPGITPTATVVSRTGRIQAQKSSRISGYLSTKSVLFRIEEEEQGNGPWRVLLVYSSGHKQNHERESLEP
jgi:hypothetical protein